MSANCFEMKALVLIISLVTLTGCVTTAEDRASQSDISWFARTLDRDPFSNLDPEEFQSNAERMLETDLVFHGVVKSEEGNPLKGAKVTASVFDHLVDPFEFPYFAFTSKEPVVTDSQGRFSFTELKGAGMYVLVEVPGWAPISAPRKLFVYAEGLNQTLPLPTSKEAPAEFIFEIRPPEAQLRRINTGALRLGEDGRPLEISLREVAPYGVEPGTGEATVTCERTIDDVTPDARFDWWCELTVPGGGFQDFKISKDQAPEEGYTETGRLEFKATDEFWDDRADRDLIIRFADGLYGFIRFAMRMGGDYYVAFDGVWNPTGSRWLD